MTEETKPAAPPAPPAPAAKPANLQRQRDNMFRDRETGADRAKHVEASKQFAQEEREMRREPADIAAADVSSLSGSGAFVEDGAKDRVDVDHPAVDNNPREGTTAVQNRIDFNDPNKLQDQAVADQLK